MKVKLNLIVIILYIIFCSCQNQHNYKVEEKYYASTNLKYLIKFNQNSKVKEFFTFYDTSDKMPFKKIYRKNNYDSIIYYYNNKKTYKVGLQDFKKRKFGNWKCYTREGFLSETREYFIVGDDYILNRQWYFNKQGDTLWCAKKFNHYNQKEFENDTLVSRNSSMIRFKFYSKDTISIDKPFAVAVICNSPLLREYNSQIMMLLGKETNNFNKNFSNDRVVKLDTFNNLNMDKVNKVNFPKANPNYVVAFGRWFDTPGKKTLRGYMLEYFNRKPTKNDSITGGERKVYFEKIVYVKDTVK
ncbi:hypothetical protein [Flavobacterium psychrotolerans]|uniref:Uncharacterized protein n=1 Tax=Flavobacterium psychrotolerans TaxID=2169410 RepID=A0A2U1JPL3_9FLAO|nr:hypothetical protein [Flavobacterium psychrotolerans]PWA06778.1 hypothetical protein DB895_01980 [Flavobacterium psychrotolerans]